MNQGQNQYDYRIINGRNEFFSRQVFDDPQNSEVEEQKVDTIHDRLKAKFYSDLNFVSRPQFLNRRLDEIEPEVDMSQFQGQEEFDDKDIGEDAGVSSFK